MRRALSRARGPLAVAIVCFAAAATPAARAATIVWKGHTWQLTSGGMAGVCQGDPNNVSIDAAGYLHLKISLNNGVWSASELFTTDKLGFGTYQWQVDGPIDTYDKNVVLGLFPYGPAAGIGADGTNEIDIEYSRWGQATGVNGDWTDYPASGTNIGEMSYSFSLGGATLSTSRFTWSNISIASFLLAGVQPIDGTTGLIRSWTYAPQNPTVNIPQQALPLGMNLWCFDSPPSDGKPVEIVIRDFAFAAAGGAGGTGGTGGGAGGSGGGRGGASGGAGGTNAGGAGGSSGNAGGASGASGAGASAGAGGTAGSSAGAGGSTGGGPAGTAGVAGTGGVTGTGGIAGAGGTGGGSAGAGGVGSGGGQASGCGCSLAAAPRAADGCCAWLIFAFLLSCRRGRSRGPSP